MLVVMSIKFIKYDKKFNPMNKRYKILSIYRSIKQKKKKSYLKLKLEISSVKGK